MRRLLVVLFVVLGTNVWAQDNSTTNDVRFLRAGVSIGEAERELVAQPGHGAILRALVASSRELDRCRFIFLGVNVQNEGDLDRVKWWEGLSEKERAEIGWFHCDRAIGGLLAAKFLASQQSTALIARDNWITAAIADLQGLDRKGLLWALPRTVFAVHGPTTQRNAFTAIYAGLGYFRDHAEGEMLEDYEQGQDTGWAQYIVIINASHRATARWAGTIDQELGLVCRVLLGFKDLQVEAAEAFQAMKPTKYTDAWLNLIDRSSWRAIDIPGRCQR